MKPKENTEGWTMAKIIDKRKIIKEKEATKVLVASYPSSEHFQQACQ